MILSSSSYPLTTSLLSSLPFFPTRRSSDLRASRCRAIRTFSSSSFANSADISSRSFVHDATSVDTTEKVSVEVCKARARHVQNRSEEHTSELQSPYDLVCRLLLEKKKTRK